MAMYCRKKLNEGEEKGSREALRCCLSAQHSRKNSSSSQKHGDGGIEKRSGRVQRDSKRQLLTLDPGGMMLWQLSLLTGYHTAGNLYSSGSS